MRDSGIREFSVPSPRKREDFVNRPTNEFSRMLALMAAARANAAQRLTELDARITLLNASMVFFIIALTITPKFLEMPFAHRNGFEFITIVLAILLLAFILLQFSAKNALRAEQLHRSALEIQDMHRLVNFKGFNVSEREFQELSKRFEEVMQRYSLKHDPIDYLHARFELTDDYLDRPIASRLMQCRIWLASGYPLLLTLVIAVAVTYMLLSAV